MCGAIATADSGLAASAAWLDKIASDIVNSGDAAQNATPSPPATPSPTGNAVTVTTQPHVSPMLNVDMAAEFADQSLALASYRASAAVLRTAEEMNKSLLDIVA